MRVSKDTHATGFPAPIKRQARHCKYASDLARNEAAVSASDLDETDIARSATVQVQICVKC